MITAEIRSRRTVIKKQKKESYISLKLILRFPLYALELVQLIGHLNLLDMTAIMTKILKWIKQIGIQGKKLGFNQRNANKFYILRTDDSSGISDEDIDVEQVQVVGVFLILSLWFCSFRNLNFNLIGLCSG